MLISLSRASYKRAPEVRRLACSRQTLLNIPEMLDMPMSHRFILASMALCLPCSFALAQATPKAGAFEIGIDATLSHTLDGDHATSIGLIDQLLRVGYFLTPHVSVESGLTLSYQSIEGSSGLFTAVQAGVLLNQSAEEKRLQLYLHPYAVLSSVRFSADVSIEGPYSSTVTRTGLGLGAGMRIPLATRLASRLEAQFDRMESVFGAAGKNNLHLALGISYLTK
jgi:hypothetical protein